MFRAHFLVPIVALLQCVVGGHYKQGAAFVPSSGLRLNNGLEIQGRCCHSPARITTLRAHMESGGSSQTRRDAIMWALASGAAGIVGAKEARAAGGSGPDSVDGPSLEKTATKKTAPSVNRNRIQVLFCRID
jgi:hypothetical protein